MFRSGRTSKRWLARDRQECIGPVCSRRRHRPLASRSSSRDAGDERPVRPSREDVEPHTSGLTGAPLELRSQADSSCWRCHGFDRARNLQVGFGLPDALALSGGMEESRVKCHSPASTSPRFR